MVLASLVRDREAITQGWRDTHVAVITTNEKGHIGGMALAYAA